MRISLLLLAALVAILPPRSARSGELPLDVVEDLRPDALHAWHLYDHEGDSPTVGDRISLVGQFDVESRSVVLRQPPWLVVSPEPRADRSRTRQVFAVGLAQAPEGLDADGFMRVEGTLVAADPDPDDGDRGYRLDAARAEPIRLARPLAELEADVAGIVRGAEARLRTVCMEHELRHDFDPDPLGMSWHNGRIAFTARLSAHPGFSFKPVAYATVSVVFDPATGEADRLIVTRRLWADPPD
ncbi:MAG: hypothetical protein ACKOZU_12920 [Planctomycetaceae bacterium]